MTSVDFIKQLQARLGGKIFEDQIEMKQLRLLQPSFPALATDYKSFHCYFNFIIEQELKIAILKPPPHRMQILPAYGYRKILKVLGLIIDLQSGYKKYDKIFMIQDIPKHFKKMTLNAEVLDIIDCFRPFKTFEMTLTKYEIFKEVLLNRGYTVDKAVGDLDYLVRLVTKIESIYKIN